MRALTADELIDLEDAILDRLPATLSTRNTDGTLERLLRELGMSDVIAEIEGIRNALPTWPDGKILLLTENMRLVDDLRGVLKSLGVRKERLEAVEYHDVTNLDLRRISYSSRYCAVLAGACPHKGMGIGDDTSVLTHMESHRDEFPEVVRLTAGGKLSVTKTNFRMAVESLIIRGVIRPDNKLVDNV